MGLRDNDRRPTGGGRKGEWFGSCLASPTLLSSALYNYIIKSKERNNLLGLRINIDSNPQLTLLLNLSLIRLLLNRHPEGILILELELAHILHVVVVVGLRQTQGSLAQAHDLDGQSEVQHSVANHVIRLEEVSIVELHRKSVILHRMLRLEEQSVVERGFAIGASVVAVRLFGLLGAVKEQPAVDVTCALHICGLNSNSVKDADSDLKVLSWLGSDVIVRDLIEWYRGWDDVYPELDRPLRNA